jgi:hypothetical protein
VTPLATSERENAHTQTQLEERSRNPKKIERHTRAYLFVFEAELIKKLRRGGKRKKERSKKRENDELEQSASRDRGHEE